MFDLLSMMERETLEFNFLLTRSNSATGTRYQYARQAREDDKRARPSEGGSPTFAQKNGYNRTRIEKVIKKQPDKRKPEDSISTAYLHHREYRVDWTPTEETSPRDLQVPEIFSILCTSAKWEEISAPGSRNTKAISRTSSGISEPWHQT